MDVVWGEAPKMWPEGFKSSCYCAVEVASSPGVLLTAIHSAWISALFYACCFCALVCFILMFTILEIVL